MTSIVSIDRVYRQWVSLGEYHTASAKFRAARALAAHSESAPADIGKVTADEFFKYLASVKRANRTPRRRFVDDGDFDDMGNGAIAAQYHYDQKRKRGRL